MVKQPEDIYEQYAIRKKCYFDQFLNFHNNLYIDNESLKV